MAGRDKYQFVLFVFCVINLVQCLLGDRKITTECYCPCRPQCQHVKSGAYINLYYTKARGESDTLHYVTSTVGYPGILVAKTSLNSTFDINLPKFLSGNVTYVKDSINFDPPAEYVYSLQFLQLLEYNDINDTANMATVGNDSSLWRQYNLGESVPWANSSGDSSDNQVVLKIQTLSNHGDGQAASNDTGPFVFLGNGSVTFELDFTGMLGRIDSLPHLQHTGNTSVIQLTVDRLRPTFSQSRFAVEMAVVTSDRPSQNNMTVNVYRSIDDEHTPGVFQVMDLTTTNETHQSAAAYLQWKPVCYRQSLRSVQTATKARDYPLAPASDLYNQLRDSPSVAAAYFGDDLIRGTDCTMSGLNVSFGLSNDKYYTHTNYTTWMLAVGYGSPPQEKVSSVVLIIISVGFGIPVLLILFGGIGVCVKKSKARNDDVTTSSEYTAIN